MNIREIIIYSHTGQVRRLPFKQGSLNVITGCSSTGKSALSDIVEYCMGRSSFNIPEGDIRDKVAWYAVIYQFEGEQVLIAKPAPALNASSCTKAMVLRGSCITPPLYSDLHQNATDDTVISLLSDLLGIPSNKTHVPQHHSRTSYSASIQHAYFYLFQKQGTIANKDQLFYRQNEQFMPQAIADTLPILLGAAPNNLLDIEVRLRSARRELKIVQKQLIEADNYNEQIDSRAAGLIFESKEVGLCKKDKIITSTAEAILELNKIATWQPTSVPVEDNDIIYELESELSRLRRDRSKERERLRAAKLFVEREDGFTAEANEQKSRLESIHALPRQPESGGWQWPFAPEGMNLNTPLATLLLSELESLDRELHAISGDRPHLQEHTKKLEENIVTLNQAIKLKEEALSVTISANATIAKMGDRNLAAAKVVGRISIFLENHRPDFDLNILRRKAGELHKIVNQLELAATNNATKERFASICNIISNKISRYVKELGAEFSEFPFRIDFSNTSNITVVIDRPERPVPMNKTGGGANHLAYHLAALLAIHHFASTNKKPIPSFLFLDQPSQVYFPSEQIYKKLSGTVEETVRDSDLEKVRNLFNMLNRIVEKEIPGLQIIVTEHANLSDEWFQNSLVESPWRKPPALVPEEWL